MRLMGQRSEIASLQERCQERRHGAGMKRFCGEASGVAGCDAVYLATLREALARFASHELEAAVVTTGWRRAQSRRRWRSEAAVPRGARARRRVILRPVRNLRVTVSRRGRALSAIWPRAGQVLVTAGRLRREPPSPPLPRRTVSRQARPVRQRRLRRPPTGRRW